MSWTERISFIGVALIAQMLILYYFYTSVSDAPLVGFRDPPSYPEEVMSNEAYQSTEIFLQTLNRDNNWTSRVIACSTFAYWQDSNFNFLFLDSLFQHNPDIRLYFIAQQTPPHEVLQAFQQLSAMGYAIKFTVLLPSEMVRHGMYLSTENRDWLDGVSGLSGKYSPSHMSDYLRFYILYRYGGVYADTDVVFLQRLPSGEFVGLDHSSSSSSPPAPWFIHAPHHYAAPRLMKLAPKRRFLRDLLKNVFRLRFYRSDCLDCVGARALNEYLKYASKKERSRVTLLPKHVLYPKTHSEIHLLFNGSNTVAENELATLRRESITVHLFRSTSSHLVVEPGSVMSLLLRLPSLIQGQGSARRSSHTGLVSVVVRENSTVFSGPNLLFFQPDELGLSGHVLTSAISFHVSVMGSCVSMEFTSSHHTPLSLSLSSSLESLGPRSTLSSVRGGCIREVNSFLQHVKYNVSDLCESGMMQAEVVVELVVAGVSTVVRKKVVTLVSFHRLVTVLVHTHNRVKNIHNLYESLQQHFPSTSMYFTNDVDSHHALQDSQLTSRSGLSGLSGLVRAIVGSRKNQGAEMEVPSSSTPPRYLINIAVPTDSGLSLARNTLTQAALTPFVFFIDDDFVFTKSSHLDVLLSVLLTEKDYGIASAVIPHDQTASGFHFRGLIDVRDETLSLVPGNYGQRHGCLSVDFVPNVFMARRSSILSSLWDPDLKLGEHEDFFLRAKGKRVGVLSCDFVSVRHEQSKWWTKEAPASYRKERSRVFDYMKQALRKHGLKRLVTFGHETIVV